MSDAADCVDWAAAQRPHPGETVSGDLAIHLIRGHEVLLAVADGLGHGPEAAEAAAAARTVLAANLGAPAALLLACHQGLTHTRGVAMTVATIDCRHGLLHWVGVGNVEARLVRAGEWGRAHVVSSAVLYGGALGFRMPDVQATTIAWQPEDILVMATDGVAGGFADDVAVAQPVSTIASSVLDRYGKGSDDALVAVARMAGATRAD